MVIAKSKKSRRGRPPKSEVGTIAPRILAAASEVFLRAGYEQANMSEVAQKAGCSKRTLYLSFPSKLALFSSFVQSFVEERLDQIRISIDPAASLEQQLCLITAIIRSYASSEELYQLHRLIVQDGRRFPELRSVMEEAAWQPGNKVVRTLLEAHFTGAVIEELTFLSDQFLGLVALRAIHHNIVGKPAPTEPPEQLVRLFLHGCSGFYRAHENVK